MRVKGRGFVNEKNLWKGKEGKGSKKEEKVEQK